MPIEISIRGFQSRNNFLLIIKSHIFTLLNLFYELIFNIHILVKIFRQIRLLLLAHHAHHGAEIEGRLLPLLPLPLLLALLPLLLAAQDAHGLLHHLGVAHHLDEAGVVEGLLQLGVAADHLAEHGVARDDVLQHRGVLQHAVQHVAEHRVVHHPLHHRGVHLRVLHHLLDVPARKQRVHVATIQQAVHALAFLFSIRIIILLLLLCRVLLQRLRMHHMHAALI